MFDVIPKAGCNVLTKPEGAVCLIGLPARVQAVARSGLQVCEVEYRRGFDWIVGIQLGLQWLMHRLQQQHLKETLLDELAEVIQAGPLRL